MTTGELLTVAAAKAGSLNQLAADTGLHRPTLAAVNGGRRPLSPRYEAVLRRYIGQSDKDIVDALIAPIETGNIH